MWEKRKLRDFLRSIIGKSVRLKGRCWIVGNDSSVYPTVTYEGNSIGAARLAYELFYGKKILKQACHKCDRRNCINPEHIFDGSQRENMKDAMMKERLIAPSEKATNILW